MFLLQLSYLVAVLAIQTLLERFDLFLMSSLQIFDFLSVLSFELLSCRCMVFLQLADPVLELLYYLPLPSHKGFFLSRELLS